MSKFLIYGLIDPRTSQLRYIGKSCSGLRRPANYACKQTLLYEGRGPKVAWLRKLEQLGLRYEVAILEEASNKEELAEAEVFNIAYYKYIGCDLLNRTIGGEGGAKTRLSEETKQKIAAKSRGRKHSVESKLKMSIMQKGKPHPWKRGGRAIRDNLGRMYSTIKEAGAILGIPRPSISNVLAGKQPTSHGLKFEYVAGAR